MKKITLLVCLSLLLALNVYAASRGVGAFIGLQDSGGLDAAAAYGGRYIHPISSHGTKISFLMNVGQVTGYQTEEDDPVVIYGTRELDVSLTTVETAILFDLPGKKRFNAYAGPGLGYYLIDVDVDRNLSYMDYDISETGTADNSVAFFMMLGIQNRLGKHARLFGEARYTLLKVTYEYTRTVTGYVPLFGSYGNYSEDHSDDLDMSGMGMRFGVIIDL